MSDVIFHTIHGSHLYGLNNSNSDIDTYTVTKNGKATQKFEENYDNLVVPLDRFLASIGKGNPQAVEALFSSQKVFTSTEYIPYINALRPGWELCATYRRAIRRLAFDLGGRSGNALTQAEESEYVQMKLRRHALRLCMNLNQFVCSGTITPRLSLEDRYHISELVYDKNYYDIIENILYDSLTGKLNMRDY